MHSADDRSADDRGADGRGDDYSSAPSIFDQPRDLEPGDRYPDRGAGDWDAEDPDADHPDADAPDGDYDRDEEDHEDDEREDTELRPGRQEPQRLQKVLASAGVGSRRVSEELIAAGRVTIDGEVAELGDRVDPTSAVIHVDGQRLVTDTSLVYLMLNKPRGVLSTMDDERGRAALADYVSGVEQRVFHVGRLDADSEGLLLLTNDGGLAHRLMHPSFGVAKTYLCEVPGPVPRALGRQLRGGVELEDGPARVDSFRVIDAVGRSALVEVVLHEGRKHIVRRLLAAVGHPVSRLVRTAIGPIKLGDLRAGRVRRLTNPEVAALFKAVGG